MSNPILAMTGGLVTGACFGSHLGYVFIKPTDTLSMKVAKIALGAILQGLAFGVLCASLAEKQIVGVLVSSCTAISTLFITVAFLSAM